MLDNYGQLWAMCYDFGQFVTDLDNLLGFFAQILRIAAKTHEYWH
jgi:hypothetical protein